jgi:hypothetical protein
MSDRTAAQRSKRYRDRKRRGYRLVGGLRLTEVEIEKLAARGYAVEPGVSLARSCLIRSPAAPESSAEPAAG